MIPKIRSIVDHFGKVPMDAIAGKGQATKEDWDALRTWLQLFIDTNHNYSQIKEELRLHAEKVSRFIVMHDTTTFADHSEDNLPPGMWQAIEEFLAAHPEWTLMARFHHNNGLTILKRVA